MSGAELISARSLRPEARRRKAETRTSARPRPPTATTRPFTPASPSATLVPVKRPPAAARLLGALALPFALSLAVALAACADDTAEGTVPTREYPVSIAFSAQVGDDPFACGTPYTLGDPGTEFVGSDLRLFVYDFVAIDSDGTHHAVVLDDEVVWQTENIALLDFEDGSATCINGTEATNSVVSGTTTTDDVAAVSFWVGVPEAENHANQALAEPPLSVTSMFWSWTSGYKFIRIDGATTGLGDAFRYHLGSTACTRVSNVDIECERPNRAYIELDAYDPASEVVVFDLAALFADSDLDENTEGSAPGCMSELGDDDCDAPAAALGLDPTTGDVIGAQRAFRVAPAAQ
jgi:uncharacterized repeat protein (TIGR04052 family)